MRTFSVILVVGLLTGCVGAQPKQTAVIDNALRLCGLGSNSLAYDSLKVALNVASNQPNASFENTANAQIETQITILLRQAEITKNDSSIKFATEQMNATRDCAVKEVALARNPSRAELLEQCRVDVYNKLQPNSIKSGVLDFWNQADGELSGTKNIVKMQGYYHQAQFGEDRKNNS